MKVIYLILICALAACSTSQEIVNYNVETENGIANVIYYTPKNAKQTYLIIPDDDSVDIQTQFEFMLDVLPNNSSVFIFPKMFYKNVIEKNSVDIPEVRKTLIAESYNDLKSNKIIDSTHKITVVGIGEGSIVSPQLAQNINASNLVLINPHYQPMNENFISIFNERDKAFITYSKFNGLATIELWTEFLYNAQNSKEPDAYPTFKPMRYYSFYWTYNPSIYLRSFNKPLNIIMFGNYNYTSNHNKKALKNLSAHKHTYIVGSMFSKDFLKELKQGLIF